jgi:hypothetical protein
MTGTRVTHSARHAQKTWGPSVYRCGTGLCGRVVGCIALGSSCTNGLWVGWGEWRACFCVCACILGLSMQAQRFSARPPFFPFFLIHRFHSISFTRAQGISKCKIGFGREQDGRVGERLVEWGGGHGAPFEGAWGVAACWEHRLRPPPHAPSCMCVAGPGVWSSPTGDICGLPFPNSPAGRDYVRAVSIQVELCSCPMHFNTVCDRWKWKCMAGTRGLQLRLELGNVVTGEGERGESGSWRLGG